MARESKYLPFFMNIQLGSAQKKIFLANTLTLYPSQKPPPVPKTKFPGKTTLKILKICWNSTSIQIKHQADIVLLAYFRIEWTTLFLNCFHSLQPCKIDFVGSSSPQLKGWSWIKILLQDPLLHPSHLNPPFKAQNMRTRQCYMRLSSSVTAI